MLNRVLAAFAGAAFAAMFHASVGQAAELTEFSSGPCDYKLSGQIEEGDARKLDKIGGTYDGQTLCLDSPGGSLPEGKRMFDAIWQSNIITHVRAGDLCESACALAFLGGSINTGTANIRFQARSIEPGARLGFHAPGLGLADGGQYSGKVVRTAFEAALDGAEMIFAIKLTEQHGARAMTDYLYQRLLSKRQSDMYYVTTVGDAVMSNISLTGVTLPANVSEAEIANLCDNTWAAQIADGRPGFQSAKEYYAQLEGGAYDMRRVTLTDTGGETLGKVYDYYSAVKFGALGCSVRVSDSWRNGGSFYPSFTKYEMNDDFGPGTDHEGGESYSAPQWYMLDPETPIAAYAEGAGAQTVSHDDFVEFTGRDLFGGDLPDGIRKTGSAPACVSACISTSDCDAVTYDRWNGYCYLKAVDRGADTLYVLTKADTYVKAPRDRDVYAARRGVIRTQTFENKGYRDKPYKVMERDSLRGCQRFCGRDCRAFNWIPSRRECEFFDKPGQFYDAQGVTAGYKKQDVVE